jgi:hypothetical protein
MTLAESRREFYLEELKNREEGKLNGIPLFYSFPKLGSVIKTIPRGYPMLWSGNSGTGKTQSWIGIFVYNIYNMKRNHPELNLNVKLLIVLLEDTKEMFIDRLYSMLFWNMYRMVVDADELHSRNENPLSKEIADKLLDVGKEINFILDDCEIVDSIYNPTGIYKWARTISNQYGEHKYIQKNFTSEDGEIKPTDVYSHYEQKDPNLQVLMIVDNLNNLAQERIDGRLLSERETINMWTRNYCRLQITKHWRFSILNVIQQTAESETQQFDFRGNNSIEKVKPTLSGLANSKECQRDHFLVVGIFAPNRYGIDKYERFDITKLGDNFRSLIILKSNLSATNKEIPFYFNGACSLMRELPTPGGLGDNTIDNLSEILK